MSKGDNVEKRHSGGGKDITAKEFLEEAGFLDSHLILKEGAMIDYGTTISDIMDRYADLKMGKVEQPVKEFNTSSGNAADMEFVDDIFSNSRVKAGDIYSYLTKDGIRRSAIVLMTFENNNFLVKYGWIDELMPARAVTKKYFLPPHIFYTDTIQSLNDMPGHRTERIERKCAVINPKIEESIFPGNIIFTKHIIMVIQSMFYYSLKALEMFNVLIINKRTGEFFYDHQEESTIKEAIGKDMEFTRHS